MASNIEKGLTSLMLEDMRSFKSERLVLRLAKMFFLEILLKSCACYVLGKGTPSSSITTVKIGTIHPLFWMAVGKM